MLHAHKSLFLFRGTDFFLQHIIGIVCASFVSFLFRRQVFRNFSGRILPNPFLRFAFPFKRSFSFTNKIYQTFIVAADILMRFFLYCLFKIQNQDWSLAYNDCVLLIIFKLIHNNLNLHDVYTFKANLSIATTT